MPASPILKTQTLVMQSLYTKRFYKSSARIGLSKKLREIGRSHIIRLMAAEKRQIYTISQITSLIKRVLEDNLPSRLTVTGEISDWRRHSSGHCYFSLKDNDAVLPCVMWRSGFAKVRFEPQRGMAVLATGSVDVYPPQGRYQFVVDRLEPAGVGALQIAFEQMVKRLEAEGLFKEEHKKPLPPYPKHICIVTSESGAAVHDIKESIWNRWPCVKLFLYPVAVQGEGAAEQMAKAVRDINRRNRQFNFDMVIVGRGGGSLEDLWAFNEEILARAIYGSQIPIVSAVGHEIDVTIADLVADVRASTPTKAGVVAVPDVKEVSAKLDHFAKDLSDRMRWILQLHQQRIDELGFTIIDSAKDMLAKIRAKLNVFFEKVLGIEPHRLLAKKIVELNNIQNRTVITIKTRINELRMQLTAQSNRLSAMNPKSVLGRGYSITRSKKNGLVVRSADDVEISDLLITELANENLIESQVTKLDNRET
jgi:exodeoxyribonuclease VII large subunit